MHLKLLNISFPFHWRSPVGSTSPVEHNHSRTHRPGVRSPSAWPLDHPAPHFICRSNQLFCVPCRLLQSNSYFSTYSPGGLCSLQNRCEKTPESYLGFENSQVVPQIWFTLTLSRRRFDFFGCVCVLINFFFLPLEFLLTCPVSFFFLSGFLRSDRYFVFHLLLFFRWGLDPGLLSQLFC